VTGDWDVVTADDFLDSISYIFYKIMVQTQLTRLNRSPKFVSRYRRLLCEAVKLRVNFIRQYLMPYDLRLCAKFQLSSLLRSEVIKRKHPDKKHCYKPFFERAKKTSVVDLLTSGGAR
jgi:hypothetical protein